MGRRLPVIACVVTSVITSASLAPQLLMAQTRSPYTAPRTPRRFVPLSIAAAASALRAMVRKPRGSSYMDR